MDASSITSDIPMIPTELNENKMKVVKELADINMLISEGKAILLKAEGDKEKFITNREKEVINRIKTVLENSRYRQGFLGLYQGGL